MSAELEIFFYDGMTGGIQRKQREGRFTVVYPTANQFPYANGAAAISAREKFCQRAKLSLADLSRWNGDSHCTERSRDPEIAKLPRNIAVVIKFIVRSLYFPFCFHLKLSLKEIPFILRKLYRIKICIYFLDNLFWLYFYISYKLKILLYFKDVIL